MFILRSDFEYGNKYKNVFYTFWKTPTETIWVHGIQRLQLKLAFIENVWEKCYLLI